MVYIKTWFLQKKTWFNQNSMVFANPVKTPDPFTQNGTHLSIQIHHS